MKTKFLPGSEVRDHSTPRSKKTAFQRQVRKAYLSTAVATMDALMARESKWKRRQTIANNQLWAVRRDIDEYAMKLARETLERNAP